MTLRERKALVEAFRVPPYKQFGPWKFGFAFPHFMYYTHHSGKMVYFIPDYEEPDVLVIQTSEGPGEELVGVEIDFSSMNASELFDLVKPFLTTGPSRKAWDPRKDKK